MTLFSLISVSYTVNQKLQKDLSDGTLSCWNSPGEQAAAEYPCKSMDLHIGGANLVKNYKVCDSVIQSVQSRKTRKKIL